MTLHYHQQPTLLIGLGGFGSKIVDNVYGKTNSHHTVSAFCIDTDRHLPHSLSSIPAEHCLLISPPLPVGKIAPLVEGSADWFPNNPLVLSKTLLDGAGQIRAVSRLAFEFALKNNGFAPLLDNLDTLADRCRETAQPLRISVVTSLVGGTGAGLFLPVALLIRRYLMDRFPTLTVKIHGEFLLPANFLFIPSAAVHAMLETNAYASIKELNAINEHFFCQAKSVRLSYDWNHGGCSTVEHLPYDYCFLYDTVNKQGPSHTKNIEEALYERLFGPLSDALNGAFVQGLRTTVRKHAGNLYGACRCETLPSDATAFHSAFYCDIINRTAPQNGCRILAITAPRSLGFDVAQLPQNTVLIETVDPSAASATVVELDYGMDISRVEKWQYKTGKYHLAYCDHSHTITPHLDKTWRDKLSDIGYTDEPQTASAQTDSLAKMKAYDGDRNFIFVSYAHRNADDVLPIVYALMRDGYRVWYDDGIDPGTEWDEFIADKIEKSDYLIAFISEEYLASANCKDELNYARDLDKDRLLVYLTDVKLSGGLAMRLNRLQAIHKYAYASTEEFMNKLTSTSALHRFKD